MKWNIYLLLFLVFLFTACVQAQKVPVKIAIIAEKAAGLDKSPLISLLEVQLLQKQGIELLERAAIEEILQEQQLSAAGLLERNNTIEIGKLLRADAFVILSLENQTKESGDLIRVRVAETAHGLRLSDRFEELQNSKIEETAERIIKEIIAVAGKMNLSVGQAIPIGIVDIHRVQLGERYKLLERALPVLLSVRLSKEPKIIMLEREDLKILLDEKLLTDGKNSNFWNSAILIDGYLQPKDGGLEMTLQLRQATGNEIAAFNVPVEPNEPSLAIEKAANEIIKQLQDSPPSTQWQPELEAEEFYQQGQLLSAHSRYEDAIIPFETAHALQPQNVFYTGSLFKMLLEVRREIERVRTNNERLLRAIEKGSINPRKIDEPGVCPYSDVEIVELVSLLVRQIRDGYNKGQLSTRDIYDKWSRSLGCDLRPGSYFSDPVSVATEQIRQINRENRKIWVETMDKALKAQLLREDVPDMNTRIRARLAWISSDDPVELMTNLRKAFTEFVMPPELGGTIESDEERNSLFYQAFQVELHVFSVTFIDHTYLKGSGVEFIELWREYLKELTNTEDLIVRINSYVALSTGGESSEIEKYRLEAKDYDTKAFEMLKDIITNPNDSLDCKTKQQLLIKLRHLTYGGNIQIHESVRRWEEICDILIEQNDIDTLAILDPGFRPFLFDPFHLQQSVPESLECYYNLLERLSDVMEIHKSDKQVTLALNRIKDFQTEIKEKFPEINIARKATDLQVTILLNKYDWFELFRFSGGELQIILKDNMLWSAFRESQMIKKRICIGLVGIDLEKKKLISQWQADVPFDKFPRLTGMVISQDASFLSIYSAGLVELPGSDTQERKFFGDPNDLYERGFRKYVISRIQNKKEKEFLLTLTDGHGTFKEPILYTQKDNLPSLLINSIAQENNKLWIAYGDRDQESGLGLYDPKTGQWETIFCSTIKGDSPFNKGMPYIIQSLTFVPQDNLFFFVYDPLPKNKGEENPAGFWKMNIRTREMQYLGPLWARSDRINEVYFDHKLRLKASSYIIDFDTNTNKYKKVFGDTQWLIKRYSEKNFPLNLELDLFVPESFLEKVKLGSWRSGSFDLLTSAIYNDKLWARLGTSQIVIVGKGESFEEADIINNDILDGEPVERFVSTPYGLVAIGNGTVGLIESGNNSK